VAVAAGDVTAGVWSAPPVDHPGLRGGGWALVGVAVLFLLAVWLIHMVAFGYWLAKVDS
jgi:hypothetical protein